MIFQGNKMAKSNKIIERKQEITELKKLIKVFPVAAILGARQCGKTTLSKQVHYDHYFDLENPNDLKKFDNPQLLLEDLKGTITIDEIQRKPGIFPLLRYLVDNIKNQKYIILGSASRDLIHQSSETLAGRIGYYILEGFRLSDVGKMNLRNLWIKGSFPRSYLERTDAQSILWRENYITTFLERDIPQLGINIPANTLRRFWTMLSHYHGQLINYSELGQSFGISDMTVRKYIDILSGTFMVRILMPWNTNLGKRLIKSPKIYIKDSGIFHTLMSVENFNQLQSHNKLGASWEGFALEQVTRSIGLKNDQLYFYKTHGGAELDLFWVSKGKQWGVEFKYSDAPEKTRSMISVMKDLDLSHLWIVYPGKDKYKLDKKITVIPLKDLSDSWDYADKI